MNTAIEHVRPWDLVEMKRRGERIVGATAHDVLSGRLTHEAGLDFVVVGDSTAITVLGHESVMPSTLDQVILFCQAAVRACIRPLVVADMPFGSFHASEEDAIKNAIRLIKEGGADAVKVDTTLLPVGSTLLMATAMVDAGIPVMAHLSSNVGAACTAEQATRFYDAALSFEEAGCFAIMLELQPSDVADRITHALGIPTLGYGCGAGCDGQDVGFHDLIGFVQGSPDPHTKSYADVYSTSRAALEAYAAEVRNGDFPQAKHAVSMDAAERARFEAALKDRQ